MTKKLLLVSALIVVHAISTAFTSSAVEESVLNVTALKGLDATLPCTIDATSPDINVVWMDKLQNVLYYNEIRMIDDARFTLAKLGTRWDLTIRQVNSKDEGRYKCMSNLAPNDPKHYYLTIFVPPSIVVENSSPDVEAPEGTSVRLSCNATGYPTPTISWSFRKASEPANSTNIKRIEQSGSILQIQNVSRYLDEIYTCSASNGFEDPDTHDIRLRVRYKPIIRIWPAKVFKSVGDTVNLTCRGQGYRQPRMYFAKDGFEIMPDDEKHIYSRVVDGHWTKLTLTIKKLEQADFGYYKCVAINSMGTTDKFMELSEQARQLPRPKLQESPSQRTSTTPEYPRQQTTTKTQNLPPELKNKGGQQSNLPIAQGSIGNGSPKNWSQQTIFFITIYYILYFLCEL